MSERITTSMYDRFPFEKWERLKHKNRLQRKWESLQKRARFWALKRRLKRHCIADVRPDFDKLTSASVTASVFPESGPLPWLDRPDAEERIDELLQSRKITPERARQARELRDNGFVVLEKFFSHDVLDDIWNNFEQRVYAGKVPIETYQKDHGDLFLGRCLNPHLTAPGLKRLTHDPRLLELLSFLMGVRAIPFQTITSFAGSEQAEHSDAIHMATYPAGYMLAAWIAFEDIHPDSGPLVYYPGSHKLAYKFQHTIENEKTFKPTVEQRGHWYAEIYEKEIARLVQSKELKPSYFYSKKGDVLVWHANLIHGGSRRNDPQLSRKSLVGHYFGEGAVCFGDLNEIMLNPYEG